MKLLFTRCTKPHQLDLKLFADAGYAPVEAHGQPVVTGTHSTTPEAASPDSFRFSTGKKYKQLLIGVPF